MPLSLCVLGAARATAERAVLGRISFPTSGSAAAQPAFIRGVLLLHSFEYDDAIAAFRRGAEDRSRLRDGLLGRSALLQPAALAEREPRQGARRARRASAPTRAARAGEGADRRARRAISTRSSGCSATATSRRATAPTPIAWPQLHAQFPGRRRSGGVLRAGAARRRFPPGERNLPVSLKAGEIALGDPEEEPRAPRREPLRAPCVRRWRACGAGLQAARTYARIAPASSHARHMPSHVFLPLGMWDEAVASDESAFAASVDAARSAKGCRRSQADFHACRGCTTSTCSRDGSRRRAR